VGTADGLTDRELWEQACDGEHELFGVLFDRHARTVYNYLFRRVGAFSDAEDLTSVVFLEAWRRRYEVTLDRESALPWLLGVANHTALNGFRAARRYRKAVARLAAPLPEPDHADAVAGRIDDERQMAQVRRALRRLPRHERDVVELCLWAGLDQQAAAVSLGVAVGTVKSRLSRARRRLGDLLAEEGRNGGNDEDDAERAPFPSLTAVAIVRERP
jgi:RNA polymerase sigma-70 factor (ECF subfamily)